MLLRVRSALLRFAGVEPSSEPLFWEARSRTGLLTYCPPALLTAADQMRTRRHARVFMTGATGYVGAHVLADLLERTESDVVCLVREKQPELALRKVRDALSSYCPELDARAQAARLSVVCGDASRPRFGLEPEIYDGLSREVSAIYHFAADTRLFGPEEDFQSSNVDSVAHCIELAEKGCAKDLHYMSTLAVCGVNPRSETVRFAEHDRDIGQDFQNFYELTKYEAEALVQDYQDRSGRGFIYRFQRNAKGNRLVQLLVAAAKLGCFPQQPGKPVVLSPVDEVARGIVAISLDERIRGGVFHVESRHSVRYADLARAMRAQGMLLEETPHRTFQELFAEQPSTRDPELALGRFWAGRPDRNVVYDVAQTEALLGALGCGFVPLTYAWVQRFVAGQGKQRTSLMEGRFASLDTQGEFGLIDVP
jgi:thioester reductase-like protein